MLGFCTARPVWRPSSVEPRPLDANGCVLREALPSPTCAGPTLRRTTRNIQIYFGEIDWLAFLEQHWSIASKHVALRTNCQEKTARSLPIERLHTMGQRTSAVPA